MITVDGVGYNTIKDAADYLKVSQKTVRIWIKRRIIAAPPEVAYGTRLISVFPEAYLVRAKASVDARRRANRSSAGGRREPRAA